MPSLAHERDDEAYCGVHDETDRERFQYLDIETSSDPFAGQVVLAAGNPFKIASGAERVSVIPGPARRTGGNWVLPAVPLYGGYLPGAGRTPAGYVFRGAKRVMG